MTRMRYFDGNFGFGRALCALNFADAKLACAAAFGGGFGRALCALNFADAKLACAEVQRGLLPALVSANG